MVSEISLQHFNQGVAHYELLQVVVSKQGACHFTHRRH